MNRIYTRSGDGGQTSLGDGSRVAKTHPRIRAGGSVDELNCCLGLALAVRQADSDDDSDAGTRLNADDGMSVLARVQNELFDLGADLTVPFSPDVVAHDEVDANDQTDAASALRITAENVAELERDIDRVNDSLAPLNSFVLPGGTEFAARLHLARSVCRRAELDALLLSETEPVNPQSLMYLNRLSDLLFVLARAANDNGRGEPLWVPGGQR